MERLSFPCYYNMLIVKEENLKFQAKETKSLLICYFITISGNKTTYRMSAMSAILGISLPADTYSHIPYISIELEVIFHRNHFIFIFFTFIKVCGQHFRLSHFFYMNMAIVLDGDDL